MSDVDYSRLFSSLSATLDLFIQEVQKRKSTLMATDEWSIKDELCHIVFWHENYAANYQALAAHLDPPLPQDMSTINLAGVEYLRKYSIKTLLNKLHKAHTSLYKNIVKQKVPRMTYSKGGRTYNTANFLEMITMHINTHTKQVVKAKPKATSVNTSAV